MYRIIRISKIRSDQDSEQINSDLSGNIIQKKTDYLRSLFIDLTKILNRSIQIYLVTFVQKKTDYLRSLFINLTKILNRSINDKISKKSLCL